MATANASYSTRHKHCLPKIIRGHLRSLTYYDIGWPFKHLYPSRYSIGYSHLFRYQLKQAYNHHKCSDVQFDDQRSRDWSVTCPIFFVGNMYIWYWSTSEVPMSLCSWYCVSCPETFCSARLWNKNNANFHLVQVIDLTSEVTIWPMTLKSGTVGFVLWRPTRCFFPRDFSSIRGQTRRGGSHQPPPLVPSKDAKWPVPARVNHRGPGGRFSPPWRIFAITPERLGIERRNFQYLSLYKFYIFWIKKMSLASLMTSQGRFF